MELKNYFAQDAEGNAQPSAACYLYNADTTNLVNGLVDAQNQPLTNPFVSDSYGLIQFKAPNGIYDLRVISGNRDYKIRVQAADVTELIDGIDEAVAAADTATTAAELSQSKADIAADAAINAVDARDDAESYAVDVLSSVTEVNNNRILAQQAVFDAENAAETRVTILRDDLLVPNNKLIGFTRTSLATAVDFTLSKQLSQAQVDIWEFSHYVTVRPTPTDFSTWDWTPAFESARILLGTLGGGVLTFGPGGVYQASKIRLDRFVVLDGRGVNATELKQIGGSNQDFIKSENFDVLTGTGLNVNNPLVPSWMGLKDIRVNGNRYHATNNPNGNTSGIPVCMYGPAQILAGTVLIYDGAGGGLYTEDSTIASGASWKAQEEGKFGNVVIRSCGGFAGWHCRGPHNNDANSIISGFNDGWGFYSEEAALYGGSFDRIGMMHTYANGRSASPALDTGSYIGSVARIDNLVTDGDNCVLQAGEIQIGKLRAYNIGGLQDGVVINGDNCSIQHMNGLVWSSSVGRTAVIVNANNVMIKGILISNNPDNDGVVINGNGCTVDINVKNFSAIGRTAMKLNGFDNDIRGNLRNCGVGFNYASGTDNRVNLSIVTSGAQVPVMGLAPQVSDRINIRSSGATVGGCKTNLQSAQIALDSTLYATTTVAHGLLYTPPIRSVRVDWIISSPDSSVWDEAVLRVVSADATNVVVGYKLATPAPAGTLARIGISIDLT